MKNKSKTIKKRVFILFFSLIFIIFLNQNIFGNNLQLEWGSQNIPAETWTEITLTNTYFNPVVVASPEYSVTTNNNGIGVWITNVTSSSFMIRTSDENFASVDSINVHYIVMEEGNWTLPESGIKVEAGKLSTNKVGFQGAGNHECPTYGETVIFSNTFNSNPLVISTRGSNNNANSWAVTFQNNPSNQANPVPNNQMCIGLSQSKAISPGSIISNETIYWIAIDEGQGNISGVEYQILWNLQDTGDSGNSWINGYPDGRPFTQSWDYTWTNSPDIIIGSQTSTAGADGSWAVIYDTGNTASIRMFVDEANERSHSGSESGGGWAFSDSGSFGNLPPKNIFINFSESLIFLNENNTINAIITDINGNQTINSAIATIESPNSTLYNISLNPKKINQNINKSNIETGIKNYTSISNGETIGETGELFLANRTSQIITFTQTYSQPPILIGIVTSNNNDNSPFIPIIHSINTTHANVSLCRDNGDTTCDNNYLSENVHYAVFDITKTNNYSWIHVGKVNATTNGGATSFSFGKTFSNSPYIWALPQTYNIGGTVTNGIGAHSWFTSVTTTGANLIGCDHPGIGDVCAGTAVEEFGYVAIDIANANFSKFDAGTQTISASTWTGISYFEPFLEPRLFVMVNSENGPQDPAYPWARNVESATAQIRYCENDGPNYCDTHNGELTRWFVLEDGPIKIGNGGDDIEKNITIETYNNIFTNTTDNITSILFRINITEYQNLGSINRINNNPDLEIEFFNSVNSIKSEKLNITSNGIFTLNITDEQILNFLEDNNNRNLRINGVNFDYFSSTQKDIIEYNLIDFEIYYETYTGNWSTNFSQTQICGVYNLSRLYSTDTANNLNLTTYNNINFTIPCTPIITLISPINNSKIFGLGEINLTWNVLAQETTLNCDLYINSILNQSFPCNSTLNNTLTINLAGGKYNWTINAEDSNNLSSIAKEENFINIVKQHTQITKNIKSINTDLYHINITLENKLNISNNLIAHDFIDSKFSFGSFTPLYNLINISSGSYNGSILGWNKSLSPLNTSSITYSVSKNSDKYNLLKKFIIGLE